MKLNIRMCAAMTAPLMIAGAIAATPAQAAVGSQTRGIMPVGSSAKVSGKHTVIKLDKKLGTCKSGCEVDVYRVKAELSLDAATKVSSSTLKFKKLTLKVKKSKLRRGSHYAITIRKANKKKPLVATAFGTVS